jgi:hypothetical protein
MFKMPRFSHCLVLAAGAVVALLQPATAQTDAARFRYATARHYRYVGCPCPRHTAAAAIMAEVWTSPFYGTFGAAEDTFWASHYPGPVQRRYYGYGWDPRLRF